MFTIVSEINIQISSVYIELGTLWNIKAMKRRVGCTYIHDNVFDGRNHISTGCEQHSECRLGWGYVPRTSSCVVNCVKSLHIISLTYINYSYEKKSVIYFNRILDIVGETPEKNRSERKWQGRRH